MEAVAKPVNKLEVEEVIGADNDLCCTFVMNGEDHTLGNALRYIISKNPDVEFCGYSIPHPAENKINFRIQSKGPSVTDILRKGLEDLDSVCQHILNTFEGSVERFKMNTQNDQAME